MFAREDTRAREQNTGPQRSNTSAQKLPAAQSHAAQTHQSTHPEPTISHTCFHRQHVVPNPLSRSLGSMSIPKSRVGDSPHQTCFPTNQMLRTEGGVSIPQAAHRLTTCGRAV
jgi:hypothetical protein